MSAHDAILKAASALFGRDGFAATGVSDLAESAGVTKRTLYKHFGSKEGVFLAWLNMRDNQSNALAFEGAKKMSEKPDGQILALFDILAGFVDLKGFHGCPFSRAILEFSGTPEQSGKRTSLQHKAAITTWFRERVEAHGVNDSAAMTESLCVLYEGTLMRLVISECSEPARLAKVMAATLLAE